MIRPLNKRAVRRRRALGRTALTVTLAVTAGIGTATLGTPAVAAAGTTAASADPVVVSPGARFVPRATVVLNSGETGFLTAQEGDDRLRWIDYATGATTVLDHRLPKPLAYDVDDFRFAEYPGDFGHGSDTVALYTPTPSPHVTLQQRAGSDGPKATVPIPEGQTYVATYGDTVITRTGTEDAATGLHLLRQENGAVRDRKLEGLPEGWHLSISSGDTRSVAVRAIKWEDSTMSQGWWVVDLATGSLKTLSTHGESVSFDRESVFHLGTSGSDTAQVYRRDDLDAEPTTLDLREVGAYDDTILPFAGGFATVSAPNPGNNEYRGNALTLRDVEGRSAKSLLAVASPSLHRTPDGSLLVTGAEKTTDYGALDWGYYLFTPAADGTVTRQRVADIEDREAEPYGISLGSGILTTADDSKLYMPHTYVGAYRSTWLKTSGRPEELNSTVDGLVQGRDGDCGDSENGYCVTMFASGDGHHGRKAGTEQDVTMLFRNGDSSWGPRVTSGHHSPELLDLSGRYGVVNEATGGTQAVLHFEDGDTGSVVEKRTQVAASVWGSTLWSAAGRWDDTGSGVSTRVAAKDLSTGTAGESFDAGCVPSDLQAVGRWVYWRCSDYWHDFKGAGVYDRQTKRSVKLGSDTSLLGDGYLVRQSDTTGLTLVDLHGGLPAGGAEADLPRRVIVTAAELGDRTVRRAGWTVDRFGGHVAYVGADRRVRIVPSGVPASRVAVIDAETSPTLDIRAGATWTSRWWLSKPAASWTLTLKNKASGRTVRTLSGGEARGLVSASWDGKDAAGKYVANGTHTWTLTAKPADGVGADLSVTGTVPVTGGAAVWRDMAGDDGFGDLLTTDAAGAVSMYRGTGTGGVSSRLAGSGGALPTGSVLVPVGDVDGDRCADVLARIGDELRAYRPGCGKIVGASSPYTPIGNGWAQYDQLTSPGDLNGDGFADLIARQKSTGDIYFYAGTADHHLKSRVRIQTDWKLYKWITGAGDLNGDGRGDLLGQDSAGVLWRYYGTAAGGVTQRERVGGGWNVYSALVGTGDLTGDGRADLLARDTTGKLWRYASTGAGTYAGRVLVGTGGWNTFKGLY
ncbi:FG-GAP-like repeat-containing protein [Streptomyces sp. NPDC005930]|uniref:FG-GAP-like repeat-containing protein n=1 Tax=Streptomyces sp. NPDC005930 TaxID=3364736 RepID=UPI00369569FF